MFDRVCIFLTICHICLVQGLSPAGAQDSRGTCGWIGVEVRAITKPFADSLGMNEPYGAIFERPQKGGPAAHAKIEAGDVLTKINGETLSSSSDFAAKIAAIAPGTRIYLDTYRDQQLIGRRVRVGRTPCPASPK
jgi:serine protease Do